MSDDSPNTLQVHYKVLSEKLLKLMYFKAKQRLLNLKEQQLWKDYCEREFGSYSTQDSSVDFHGASTHRYIPPKFKKPSSTLHNESSSQSILDLQTKKSSPKRVIYQKSVISKAPGKPHKAEFTQFEVIKISKKDGNHIIENTTNHKNEKRTDGYEKQYFRKQPEAEMKVSEKRSLEPTKQTVQRLQGPRKSARDFTISRPSSKAVSFLLPQKLQEDRAVAWKAYVKSSPPRTQDQFKRLNTVCKSTQTHSLTDASMNTLEFRLPGKKDNTEKQKKIQKQFLSQSTQTRNKKGNIPQNDLDEIIQSFMEDLVADTVEELCRLEMRESQQKIQLDNLWCQLCELESSEEEIKRRWGSLQFSDLWTQQKPFHPVKNSQPNALPIIILNKGEKSQATMENKKESYCEYCDYCKCTARMTNELKPLVFTKRSSLSRDQKESSLGNLYLKRELHLSEREAQAIEECRFHQFPLRRTIHNLSNISSKTITEKVPDAILESILSDIAAEITDAPGDIVTHLYEQEFYPHDL